MHKGINYLSCVIYIADIVQSGFDLFVSLNVQNPFTISNTSALKIVPAVVTFSIVAFSRPIEHWEFTHIYMAFKHTHFLWFGNIIIENLESINVYEFKYLPKQVALF